MANLKSAPARLGGLPPVLGAASKQDAQRQRDQARDQKHKWRKLYSTKRWRTLRLEILDRDGWTCQQTGQLLTGKAPAPNSPVVDHIIPHRGDLALFWDPANLQAVTKGYHDSEKQRQEKSGQDAPAIKRRGWVGF